MAEEQVKLSQDEEQFNSTFDVMQSALDEIQAKEGETSEEPVIETPAEESAQDEPRELASDSTTDVKTPTYQEAEEVQQESSSAKDVKSETPEETLSDGEERKTREGLSEEDADVYGNLKPKAQERFEHWINKAKELETSNQELQASSELQDHIMQSGTSPEQLNWSLQIFRSLNSGDYNESVRALKALDQFSDQIGQTLGVNKTDNDSSSYTDFEDLSNAVQNLEMSEEWATRLAEQRVGQNSQLQAQETFNNAQMEQQHYQHNYEQTAQKAYQDITEWENSISSSDPDYNVKKDIMVEIGQEIANSNISPELWLPTIQREYNTLSRGMSTVAQSNGNASKSSGPLAPSRSSGGVGNAMELDTPEVTPEFLQAHLDAIHR